MRYVTLLALIGLSGCGIFCDEDKQSFEIAYDPYGPGTTDYNVVRLSRLEDDGYDCTMDGYVRDGAGTPIGERWTCSNPC